jgi:PAS domain S-box-containing protein
MKQEPSTLTALRMAVTYVAVSLLWLAASDSLLMTSIADPQTRALVGWAKGCLFVLLTGSALYTWVHHRLRERDVALALKDQALLKEQAASLMLKELARISTSPMLICDRVGRIMAINDQAMMVSGLDEPAPPAAIDNLSKLTAPGCSWLLDAIEQATHLAHAETVIERVELATGPATLQIFRGPIPGKAPGDHPLGYFLSAVDVTSLLSAQEQLRESEQRYKRMFDANPYAMSLYDTATCAFLAVNDAAVAQYGYSHDEFLGMTLFDIRPRDETPRLVDYLKQINEHPVQEPTQAGVWRHQTKNGQTLDVELLYVDLLHEGRPARLVLARDVTSVLKVEQALKTSQRQLAELTQRLLVQDQLTTQKVAQTLHDDLGQRLYACTLLLEPSPAFTEARDLQVIQAKALTQVQAALTSLRAVLVDLRPPFLEDGGVISALKYELARIYPHGSEIKLTDLTEGHRWQPHIEHGVFMIGREAVLNAIQHANAQLISAQVKWADHTLSVTVQDDGRGIPEHLLLGRPGHLGITGMRERAASLGGKLRITSTPGHGAKVCFEMRVPTP